MKRVVLSDLGKWWFVPIQPSRRPLFTQSAPPFGQAVLQQFSDAVDDVEAATRCVALDQSTAAVFHLMRIVESGLHAFAKHLAIPMASTLDVENWKNIIDQIDKEIRKLEQQPKTPDNKERRQRYSEAASEFWYFKEAWRNHVSHSRVSYGSEQALKLWRNVRSFMQTMAGIVSDASPENEQRI